MLLNITSLISITRNLLLNVREMMSCENSKTRPVVGANHKKDFGLTLRRKFIPNPKGIVRRIFMMTPSRQLKGMEQAPK